ncbi:hypothetical protein [Gemmatimonas sp.]|jgi:hypothetical protein|uniref:hypothetical protein n=1 Tax=Gemmatimonas sp. TaxID=1962908 RepID=UPI0037BEAAD5
MTARAWILTVGTLLGLVVASGDIMAQSSDSTRARVPADTTRAAAPKAAARNQAAVFGRYTPPITPRRAFLYSALLPGLGQSRLDRGSSGALFAAVELAALVMVRRSSADLREARRYRADTLPRNFTVTGDTLFRSGILLGRYNQDLIRTRRLHVEDWLAVIAFTHLFAGADAFVAAQLWDVPLKLSAVPSRGGALFVASLAF